MNNIKKATDVGIKASLLDLTKIAARKKPKQVRDEIPTLNKFGYMKFELDELSEDFINYSASLNIPVLEIGTAYGFVVHQALHKGIQIIANDISQEHLEILVQDAPKDKLDNLNIYQGGFPNETEFPKHSLGAILSSRVLHFFNPAEIEEGLNKMHNWLVGGGKIFISSCSIYHSGVRPMLPRFEQKIAEGDKWPGIITNHNKISPVHAAYTGDFLNVFEMKQLEELLPKHGFRVDKISYFDYPSDPWPDEGKGHIGFVATKI